MDLKTANRLQQLRKENGYSQDALAEKLGLSRQAISKWERGESSPAIVYVALGLTVGWHPTWLVFLLIPIYYHFAGACMTKSQKAFMMAQPIPEVIITVFLVLGVCAKLWHPAWVLFLIIPVYYWLVAVYVKKPKKK